MDSKLLAHVKEIIVKGRVLEKEPMKNHTTFKIGGKADVFIEPGSIKEAEDLLRLLCMENEKFIIIGNGSNVLISDEGIKETVICFSKGTDDITVCEDTITAGAGAMLSRVAKAALDNSLTGLEFASGIPGSLGGAVYMNAGAYGGEMKDVIVEVTLFDVENQKLLIFQKEDMDFGYRHSIAKEKPYVVLSVRMKLDKGDDKSIRHTMDELNGKRREKQPLEYPSAGSTFKRPEGYFAGKLIEDAGLRGYTVGGAQVSEKHCGFVINKGNATGSDVKKLMDDVTCRVYESFGVKLEPEVVMLGFDK